MTPIVDGFEATYGEQLTVKRINAAVGDGPEIMRSYRIPGHPTVMIFDRNGQEVQRLAGVQPAETIEKVLLLISVEP